MGGWGLRTSLEGIARGDASGEDEVGDARKRRKVIFGEPKDGFQEVARERSGMEEPHDGLSGKIDRFDFFQDDARDGAPAERNKDEVTRAEGLVGCVGECATVGAVDFSRNNLEKHRFIIAWLKD